MDCVPVIVEQHADDAAHLRHVRSTLVRAPHVKLLHVARHDERIAAHLDGLAVAGAHAAAQCAARLESPSAGTVFAATALAIARGDAAAMQRSIAIAKAEPDACRAGLVSAFGWVSPKLLQGLMPTLWDADDAFRRSVALAACELQRVPADAQLRAALEDEDEDASLRAQALRMVGRLGRLELLPLCTAALADADATYRLEAACASLLLGDRRQAVEALKVASAEAPDGPARTRSAITGLLLVLEPRHARVALKALAHDASDIRRLIRGIGFAGDPHFVPWLLGQMEQPALARLAGEAFSLIAGVDLAELDLERLDAPPHDAGPNDDPNDDDVAMDEDEGLPWPDVDKLHAWWKQHQSRFPAGTRFFMGEPLNAEHCVEVLKTGRQRQRILAAHHRSLLAPGTPLFNCAAPAWRQRRALGLS